MAIIKQLKEVIGVITDKKKNVISERGRREIVPKNEAFAGRLLLFDQSWGQIVSMALRKIEYKSRCENESVSSSFEVVL